MFHPPLLFPGDLEAVSAAVDDVTREIAPTTNWDLVYSRERIANAIAEVKALALRVELGPGPGDWVAVFREP